MNPLQIILQGLSLSAIYAVLALGFVIIYKGTKVVNLAQGAVMLLGVYVISLLAPSLGFWAAAAVGVLVGVAVAVLMQLTLSAARTHDHLVMVIITIGFSTLLGAALTQLIGPDLLFTSDPWGNETVSVLGATLPMARLVALLTSTVIIVAFFLVFRFTPFGIQLRASSGDPETAALMGISQRRVALWAWALGGALAVVAGIFLAAFPANGLDYHSSVIALSAIPAIIIGGMDSIEGSIVGALIVGFADAVFRAVIPVVAPWLGASFAGVIPFILMVLILLIRPNGLFGGQEVSRV